jgi:hypothetical protein
LDNAVQGSSEDHDLETDLELALAEYEKSLLPGTPRSSRTSRPSTEPSQAQIVQEDEQGGSSRGTLDGLRCGSPLREQDHSIVEQQDQRRQPEAAVVATREVDQDDNGGKRGPQGEKRPSPDEMEQISCDVYHPENSDHSHNTSCEDEESRPAKRRRRRPERPRTVNSRYSDFGYSDICVIVMYIRFPTLLLNKYHYLPLSAISMHNIIFVWVSIYRVLRK